VSNWGNGKDIRVFAGMRHRRRIVEFNFLDRPRHLHRLELGMALAFVNNGRCFFRSLSPAVAFPTIIGKRASGLFRGERVGRVGGTVSVDVNASVSLMFVSAHFRD